MALYFGVFRVRIDGCPDSIRKAVREHAEAMTANGLGGEVACFPDKHDRVLRGNGYVLNVKAWRRDDSSEYISGKYASIAFDPAIMNPDHVLCEIAEELEHALIKESDDG